MGKYRRAVDRERSELARALRARRAEQRRVTLARRMDEDGLILSPAARMLQKPARQARP